MHESQDTVESALGALLADHGLSVDSGFTLADLGPAGMEMMTAVLDGTGGPPDAAVVEAAAHRLLDWYNARANEVWEQWDPADAKGYAQQFMLRSGLVWASGLLSREKDGRVGPGDVSRGFTLGVLVAAVGARLAVQPLEGDLKLGARTKRERSEGGKGRWAETAPEREAERQRWRDEAARITAEAEARGFPRPTVSGLARAVIRRLRLSQAESTVRHALGKLGR